MDCKSTPSDATRTDRIANALIRSAPPSELGDRGVGRWIVAYSGGVDSTVLLHALRQIRRSERIVALHVHHGLHPQADAWAAHCQSVCDALGVPLTVARAAVARDGGEGLEAAARRARYGAFEAETSAPGDVLVTEHQRDDQAETFVLRALRASGTDALGAMRAWRRLGEHWLWRPLLDVSRADVLAYARQHGLTWIDDPSNADMDPDRNFVRHRVLTRLRERWPHADEAFSRSAALHAESSDLLDAEDARALAGCATIDPNVLSIDALTTLPQTRRARVLRRWIAALALPPLPAQGVARIESELLNARIDASPEFRWRGAAVRRSRDALHADTRRVPLPDDCRLQWSGDHALRLPTGDRLQLIADGTAPPPAFETAVTVHARFGGERIALPGRTHSHALKHVLQDLGIPRWEREAMPLLSTPDGDLLAAGDLAYSGAFDDWLRRNGCRLRWTRDPPRTMP